MVSMQDIARHAGVSPTTVSFVLNDRQPARGSIGEETRARVLEAAQELGYRRNELARSVAMGKSRMIGYLVSEPRYEPYWNTIIGALNEAELAGYTLKVFSVSEGTFAQRIQQCTELRLGGIIVRMDSDKSALFEEANTAQIPVVNIDDGVPQPFGTRVAADDEPGCRAAIDHLVALGHRKISFITSGFEQKYHKGADIGSVRETIFRREMAAHGLNVPDGYVTYESMMVFPPISNPKLNYEVALDAALALLQHPAGRPTAIFCWRDETAMAAARACQMQGLRIPEDISLVGFSDINAAQFHNPPLTTVQSPWEAMGRMAVRQLVADSEQRFDSSPRTHLLPTGFVVRESSGPAPQ